MNKPKCRINKYGTKHWVLNDEFHRTDGPAIEHTDGTKEWFINGRYHRTDGPALECADGRKSWYLDDGKVHPETIVDLWLARGVFCYYDETNDCLNFGDQNE